jgi:hypothetical protein
MSVQNANCKALYGISTVCGDNLFPGGADKDFWVGYVSDLSTKIPSTQIGPISSLAFAGYNGLVKFQGNKGAHKFDWATSKGGGGNIAFIHRAILKLLPLNTQDDVEIQRLIQAQDAFIIYQNNNDQFFILGAQKGLTMVPGELGTTGQATTDDVTDTVTLEGAEKTKPLRFLVTDVATTILYLDNRVI